MPVFAERRSGAPHLLDQVRVGDDHDGGAAKEGFAHGSILACVSWQRLVNAHPHKLSKQSQEFLNLFGDT